MNNKDWKRATTSLALSEGKKIRLPASLKLECHLQISLSKTELLVIPASLSVQHYISIKLSSDHHCRTEYPTLLLFAPSVVEQGTTLDSVSRTHHVKTQSTYSPLSLSLCPPLPFLGTFSILYMLPHEGGTECFCTLSQRLVLDPLWLGLYLISTMIWTKASSQWLMKI